MLAKYKGNCFRGGGGGGGGVVIRHYSALTFKSLYMFLRVGGPLRSRTWEVGNLQERECCTPLQGVDSRHGDMWERLKLQKPVY